MKSTDMKFFDEYKRLGKLCTEMYNDKRGVSCYIDDMEAANPAYASKVRDCSETLRELKRLRHIRNQLAHDAVDPGERLSTKDDIEWLQDFEDKIYKQTDPITKYRKVKANARKAGQNGKTKKSGQGRNVSQEESGGKLTMAMGIVGVIIVVAVIYILMKFIGAI